MSPFDRLPNNMNNTSILLLYITSVTGPTYRAAKRIFGLQGKRKLCPPPPIL